MFAVFLLCGIGAYLVTRAAEDIRMVMAFNMDEWQCAWVLTAMAQGDFLFPKDFYNYQSVYFYLSYPVLIAKRLLLPSPSLQVDMVLVMRWVSFLMGMLSLAMMARISRCLGISSRLLLTFVVVQMIFISKFFYYCYTAHPDTTQMFFLLAGFYFFLRRLQTKRTSYVAVSGLLLGVAAGTKYAGVFAVPVLMLGLLAARDPGPRAVLREITSLWLFFAIGFLGTNPHWVVLPRESLGSFVGVPGNIGVNPGKMFYPPSVATLAGWKSHIALIGFGTLLCGILAAVLIFRRRRNRDPENVFATTILMWCLFFGGFVVLSMRANRNVHHLFPILPFLAIGNAYALHILGHARVMPVVVAILLALNLPILMEFRTHDRIGDIEQDQRIRVGRFLAAHADTSSRVLYPFYTWVPVEFKDAYYFHPTVYPGFAPEGLAKAGIDLAIVRTETDSEIFGLLARSHLYSETARFEPFVMFQRQRKN